MRRTLSDRRCLISAEALASAEAEATKHLPNESGGILLGHAIDGGVVVLRVGDSGPDAVHARAEFRRDGEHAQRLRDEVVRETTGSVDYIGEWHSHPAAVDASPKDRLSMYAISADANYAITDPVLLVLRRARGERWTAAVHQIVGGRLRPLRVEVIQNEVTMTISRRSTESSDDDSQARLDNSSPDNASPRGHGRIR